MTEKKLTLQLDFHSGLPIYTQIVTQIQSQLANEILKPGDQLPTVRALAQELRVNFNTVARAYRMLDEARIISTQQGRGTYITEIPPPEVTKKLQEETLIEFVEADFQLLLDALDGLVQRRARGDVMGVGIDLDLPEAVSLLPRQGVELVDGLDLVAEQRDAPGAVLHVGGEQLHCVAAHAKGTPGEVGVVAPVVQGDEIGEQLALGDGFAGLQFEGHGGVGLHRADAVDAGHGGDDDDVVALEQGAGGGVAHAVDLLVYARFLLDIGVGARHIGFRLVVVVIGDEIFHRVAGEEALELAIELGRQGLVRRQDERRALGGLDDLSHGEGLARAGDAEQHLGLLALLDAGHKVANGLGLVAARLEVRRQGEGKPALALLRPLRAVGRPGLAAEFGPPAFQQVFQRVDGGLRAGAAHRGNAAAFRRHVLRRVGKARRLARSEEARLGHVGQAGGLFLARRHGANMARLGKNAKSRDATRPFPCQMAKWLRPHS